MAVNLKMLKEIVKNHLSMTWVKDKSDTIFPFFVLSTILSFYHYFDAAYNNASKFTWIY